MNTAHKEVEPYVSAQRNISEFTALSVGLGILLALVLGAANLYLALYAGMTVSASIPAAVISMGILRGALKKGNILQNNIVQTIASAGESLAAGVSFTVPALVLVGVWQNFEFWPTTLIAATGGLLGVVFMVPLRRALIVEEEGLTYPEGVACSEVLICGEKSGDGIKTIAQGFLYGAAMKFAIAGLGLVQDSVVFAERAMNRVFFIGSDVSVALIGVGYIINLPIAALVMLGGLIGCVVGIPLLGSSADVASLTAVKAGWKIWSEQVRYMGVGAMIVGGIWSIIQVRHGIRRGCSGMFKGVQAAKSKTREVRTERDMGLGILGAFFIISVLSLLGLYNTLISHFGIATLTTVLMVITSFVFVAVSSYIVGLVGTSNNPVSGMTICTILGTAALMLVLGMKGDSAILATLGVAGVVCCAAAIAGDASQDLKCGQLVGSTPRKQQFGQVIGVLITALLIAPMLHFLHAAYGIGDQLPAPQATLFAGIVQGFFGDTELPKGMIMCGVVIALVLIVCDEWLRAKGSKFRTHVMPVAVGIYLPITLAVPIFLGGIARFLVEKRRQNSGGHLGEAEDAGILVGAGFIAGEALMALLIAALIIFAPEGFLPLFDGVPDGLATLLGLGCLAGFTYLLYRYGAQGKAK